MAANITFKPASDIPNQSGRVFLITGGMWHTSIPIGAH
jgi:hypothetical protein